MDNHDSAVQAQRRENRKHLLILCAAGVESRFLSQSMADMLIDLLDKSITVLVVTLVLNAMPASLRERYYFAGWQQTPISREKRLAVNHKQSRFMSLRSKIVVLVTAGMVTIAAAFVNASDEVRRVMNTNRSLS